MDEAETGRGGADAVSVIVPSHGGGDRLRRCLTALQACRPPPGEIIVVADSDPEDDAIARGFGVRVLAVGSGCGPAMPRNAGAAAAKGDLLLFVDADVEVRPDVIARVLEALDRHPEWDAVFGSYDDSPDDPGFFSQFKNLFHHHTHQSARTDAETFWGGVGAVRKEAFVGVGGFDPRQRWLEDIDLGYRLRSAGHRIGIWKSLQGKHLKSWTLPGMVRSDVLHRAVPWTRLMVRHRRFRGELNLGWAPRLTALLLAGAILATVLAVAGTPAPWGPVAAACLVGLLLLNLDLYQWYRRERGLSFAVGAVFAHWLYLISCWVGLTLGLVMAGPEVFAPRRVTRELQPVGAKEARQGPNEPVQARGEPQ